MPPGIRRAILPPADPSLKTQLRNYRHETISMKALKLGTVFARSVSEGNFTGRHMSMMSHYESEGGFTLVEVLVSTVIVGVLAALAIPFFAVYKAQTFNTKADADL